MNKKQFNLRGVVILILICIGLVIGLHLWKRAIQKRFRVCGGGLCVQQYDVVLSGKLQTDDGFIVAALLKKLYYDDPTQYSGVWLAVWNMTGKSLSLDSYAIQSEGFWGTKSTSASFSGIEFDSLLAMQDEEKTVNNFASETYAHYLVEMGKGHEVLTKSVKNHSIIDLELSFNPQQSFKMALTKPGNRCKNMISMTHYCDRNEKDCLLPIRAVNWGAKVYFDESGVLYTDVKRYYDQGVLSSEETYRRNQRDGVYKQYYLNGTLKEESFYVQGKLHNESRMYYEDGTLWFRKEIDLGRVLVSENYDQQGKLHTKDIYEDNRFILREYYQDGKKVNEERFE